jgi:nitroreductase
MVKIITGASMDTLFAIHSRFSTPTVSAEPVPRELVEQLLSAAVQAPNHYRVRPWRFIVMTGAARERLGDVMVESFRERFPEVGGEAIEKERAKPLRAPLLIAVGVDPPADPRVIEVENICAAAAACENILLTANALGLAAQWRTGDTARDPRVKHFLGLEEGHVIIAFLYIGFPAFEPATYKRPGFEERTVWMD